MGIGDQRQKELAMENVTGALLTADEVAGRLRVPRSWVYRAARSGDLPSVRCGRYRRFDEVDVDRWIAEQKGTPTMAANGGRSAGRTPSFTAPS